MKAWVLIIYFYAGPAAEGDSVSVAVAPQLFYSQQECSDAGAKVIKLAYGSAKLGRFACVVRTGQP